ncbi:Uu.00g116910.m01.CDS01 [Anthostomella pinea]|uniref:Uu.00g116910.m01.CDS01 n=1 Tax=Anthostomella pinea TaxID=933095 RepID=A0AAI8VAW7_9PEZI|nr:Uu.00g116910.m01.CDS01 [Anthostomella pinea]
MVLRKHELEAKLKDDLELVQSGLLRDENPLDLSDGFNELLQACRRGDLRRTQELISAGVNLNGKDRFDYTPLIIASLCGHYELVELLLEAGAAAERDTFQGERCIYNALNDKIRNLLLKYDYSKSTDPLQPWAAHISSLLTRSVPKTSDITLIEESESFELHKFILSARSPYFQKKLTEAPETATWKLPHSKPIDSFRVVLRYLYLGQVPKEIVDARSSNTEEEVLTGIDKVSKQLEIPKLWEAILSGNDRRLARQRHQDEVSRAQEQIEGFFREKVIGHKMTVDTRKVSEVKWQHDNSIFADCLLRADEEEGNEEEQEQEHQEQNSIPIGPGAQSSQQTGTQKPKKSIIYPVHKAMLIRSPYFETMFSSQFLEAQESEHLHVIKVDCIPEVLEIVLTFLYTEKVDCPLELGLDLLYASDMLFLDKLKTKAAVAISSLGSGNNNVLMDRTHGSDGEKVEIEVELINVYDVVHAAWDLRVQRLEEFAERYIAYRLEDYIDEEEFAELVQESAARIKNREETDTIELLDDIRYYLGERFRLRFEDAGLDEMLDETGEIDEAAVEALSLQADALNLNSMTQSTKDGLGHRQETAPTDMKPAEVTGKAKTEVEGPGQLDGAVRTLDGELVGDEFAADAINYQVLLHKIDVMLENLKLDA